MVNSPLIRPYLLGGSFGGGTLDSHDNNIVLHRSGRHVTSCSTSLEKIFKHLRDWRILTNFRWTFELHKITTYLANWLCLRKMSPYWVELRNPSHAFPQNDNMIYFLIVAMQYTPKLGDQPNKNHTQRSLVLICPSFVSSTILRHSSHGRPIISDG